VNRVNRCGMDGF